MRNSVGSFYLSRCTQFFSFLCFCRHFYFQKYSSHDGTEILKQVTLPKKNPNKRLIHSGAFWLFLFSRQTYLSREACKSVVDRFEYSLFHPISPWSLAHTHVLQHGRHDPYKINVFSRARALNILLFSQMTSGVPVLSNCL